jgi:type IV pilus assembly protein PilW
VKSLFCAGPDTPRGGFTLVELLLGLSLAILLVLGLEQIVAAASAAGGLQDNQAQIQDRARFAVSVLSRAIREAGYRPEPWGETYDATALTGENRNGVSGSNDRLAVRSWSDLNCFDNRNPDLDSEGHPRFYVRESVFDLTGAHNLARLCRYGPTTAELTTQISRQGLLPGVESFQVLYGEDGDGDGHIERWVEAGQWSDTRRVLGVRIGLLLASEDAVVEPRTHPFQVLNVSTMAPADGRLRRLVDFAVAIRGRIQ